MKGYVSGESFNGIVKKEKITPEDVKNAFD